MATWMVHVEGGPKRVNHAAVCVGAAIYSFGGYCTGDDFSTRKDMDIHRFDTNTYTWTRVEYRGAAEDTPYQRYGHTAVAYNGSCYIYGGRNDVNGVCEHLYRFDIATHTWHRPTVSGAIPLPRDGHSCCMVGDCMYLFGGFEEQSMEFSKTVYSLDVTDFVWRYCAVSGVEPMWRDFHSATAWNNYMVVFGGRSDELGPLHTGRELYDNDIYMYDTINRHWTKPHMTGQIPEGRRSHNAFEYEGKIYIFGGYNGKLGKHYNDIYIYDPETHYWSMCNPCGSAPRVRRRACCCTHQNRIFIFGGTSPEKSKNTEEVLLDLSDLYILDMAPSLRTLCMIEVVKKRGWDPKLIPSSVVEDLKSLVGAEKSHTGRVPNG